MLSLSCRFLTRLKPQFIAGCVVAALLMGVSLSATAGSHCHNGPISEFSQAVYASDFDLAQTLIPSIRRERSIDMADFLQQVLVYTRGYEMGLAQDKEQALSEIDALIERISVLLETDQPQPRRLDAGNIMMNAARLHLLSRNVLRSAQLAKAAYSLLDEILQENPQQADTYLSVGLYQYFAANENNAWGWVKRLLDLQGDKERGRDLIERAVESSDDFAFEAARTLMMDLAWDHPDVCRYVEVFDQHNTPDILTIEHRQRSIAARLFCGQSQQGTIELQEIASLIKQHALIASEGQLQWLFEAGLQAIAMQGQSGVLRERLSAELEQDTETSMMIRFALARALDVNGERPEAQQHYARVAASTVDERYRRLAVSYEQQAYRAPQAYVVREEDRIQLACAPVFVKER